VEEEPFILVRSGFEGERNLSKRGPSYPKRRVFATKDANPEEEATFGEETRKDAGDKDPNCFPRQREGLRVNTSKEKESGNTK